MTIFPCPKPRSLPKAPKGLKKVNRARKKVDDARVYGPPARRKLVSLGPCSACHADVLCDNAHVLGNDGMGRKMGYKSITSLCRPRPDHGGIYQGCHSLFDTDPAAFRRDFPDFNPAKAARQTERRWQRFLRSGHSNSETSTNG